ncbi:MAG: PD-(D/E)XK nuclease family protein [Armatimonadota bacterium]
MLPTEINIKLSHSSYTMFDQCQRRWLYRYACDHFSRDVMWALKKQCKLSPWAVTAGKVVDLTISHALTRFRHTGDWPQKLPDLGLKVLEKLEAFSRRWVAEVSAGMPWPQSDYYNPIDRHYYNEEITEEEQQDCRDKIATCLRAFAASGPADTAAELGVQYWIGPRQPGEKMPSFRVHQADVWASFDFAIRTPGVTYIIDWKTGKQSEHSYERALAQLHWYALYATTEWQVPAEQIRLVPVWLADDAAWRPAAVSQKSLEELAERIRERYQLLTSKVQPILEGRLLEEEWTPAASRIYCQTCQFRGSCTARSKVPGFAGAASDDWPPDPE